MAFGYASNTCVDAGEAAPDVSDRYHDGSVDGRKEAQVVGIPSLSAWRNSLEELGGTAELA